MKKACLRAVLAFGVLGLAAPASADEASDRYSYRFDDDLLDAGGLMPQAARIVVREKKPRVTLIRPRGSFVPELLKSVEKL